MTEYLYVLGAPDPEMAAIERRLIEAGHRVVYATASNARVHPGNAYAADPVTAPKDTVLVLVECGWPDQPSDSVIIDHHKPGHPGYGRPPEEYMSASSLGQVLSHIGREPGMMDRYVAAADHCLSAAYRGRCPGVDPDALMH